MTLPSENEIRTASGKMDDAWNNFYSTQLDFAKLIYNAGNQDRESFCAALKESLDMMKDKVIGINPKLASALFSQLIAQGYKEVPAS